MKKNTTMMMMMVWIQQLKTVWAVWAVWAVLAVVLDAGYHRFTKVRYGFDCDVIKWWKERKEWRGRTCFYNLRGKSLLERPWITFRNFIRYGRMTRELPREHLRHSKQDQRLSPMEFAVWQDDSISESDEGHDPGKMPSISHFLARRRCQCHYLTAVT